jgi:hypothetical protein
LQAPEGPDSRTFQGNDGNPNPNLETRNPKQIRNPNIEKHGKIGGCLVFLFDIRICFGFRASDFGFLMALAGQAVGNRKT